MDVFNLLFGKKGQLTIIGFILFFVMLLLYVVFLPAINEVINIALPYADTMTTLMLSFTPFILFVAIIGSLMIYLRPQY